MSENNYESLSGELSARGFDREEITHIINAMECAGYRTRGLKPLKKKDLVLGLFEQFERKPEPEEIVDYICHNFGTPDRFVEVNKLAALIEEIINSFGSHAWRIGKISEAIAKYKERNGPR